MLLKNNNIGVLSIIRTIGKRNNLVMLKKLIVLLNNLEEMYGV